MSADIELSRIIADVEGVEIIGEVKTPSHLDSALWYARKLSWPVFPLVARGKKPLTTNGFHDATCDADQIRAWWARWPDANLGTPTGAAGCGFDVVDLDGDAGLARQTEFAAELDVRAIAFTPGDGVKRKPGRHLYVPASGDGCLNGFADGCDYKGIGGYCCLPPSVALHGVRYAWISPPEVSGG